jgi:hypothetical protein
VKKPGERALVPFCVRPGGSQEFRDRQRSLAVFTAIVVSWTGEWQPIRAAMADKRNLRLLLCRRH